MCAPQLDILPWINKEKVRDEMKKSKAQIIQSGVLRWWLLSQRWEPPFAEDSLVSCLRATDESRGAEESDTQHQPLREPWGKVSPPLSPSLHLFPPSTFLHLWAAISQKPGSSHYTFRILTESINSAPTRVSLTATPTKVHRHFQSDQKLVWKIIFGGKHENAQTEA